MKEVRGYVQPFLVSEVLNALKHIPDLPVVVVSDVLGWAADWPLEVGAVHDDSEVSLHPKSRVEVVVPEAMVGAVVDAICEAAKTDNVFVSDIAKPRSGSVQPEGGLE